MRADRTLEPIEAPIVTDAAGLSELSTRLLAHSRVALDAEGDGMFRYRGRLCTLQLAASGQLAIVDTLSVSPTPILSQLLGEQGPEKIVHDVAFDARVLNAHGITLANVFDTAIAARFLGLHATGLSSLLEKRFQVRLDKHHQQADWGKRPLSQEMLRYLVDDVRHLEALADTLLDDVQQKDIEAEVREETRYVLRQACAPESPLAPWMRIKGAAQLMPRQRAVLRALARAREELAQDLDLPAGRVVASELLVRLSVREGLTLAEAQRALTVGSRPHAARFVDAFAFGCSQADAPEAEVAMLTPTPLSPASIEARKRRRKLLTDLRVKEANLREVDVQVVLPGHCLGDIVALDEISAETLGSVAGFGEVRLARYARAWSAALSPAWPQ